MVPEEGTLFGSENMTVEIEEKITRSFRITELAIKDALGLSGELVKMGLWRGLSPNQESEGVSMDTRVWYFETLEYQYPLKDESDEQSTE